MVEFMDQLKQLHREKPVEGTSPETQYLDKEGFKKWIKINIDVSKNNKKFLSGRYLHVWE